MVGWSAPKSFCVQVFNCCGVKQPGAGGVVWMNSKPLFVRPSKLDCTLITFKFIDQKISPKTTLIKHCCLFRVIFCVFFWLLNLNITKVLCYWWKALQSSTKIKAQHTKYFRLVFYYYYHTICSNTTIVTQYAKILILSHKMFKYYYYHKWPRRKDYNSFSSNWKQCDVQAPTGRMGETGANLCLSTCAPVVHRSVLL